MVVQYFVPHAASEFLFTYANDFVIVIGILALPIGIYSLVNTTLRKARFEPSERFYSMVTLAGFAVMVLTGRPSAWLKEAPGWMRFLLDADNPGSLHRHLFNHVLHPAQATLMSLL